MGQFSSILPSKICPDKRGGLLEGDYVSQLSVK